MTPRARILAGLVAVLLLGWLVLGSALAPDGSGIGTHRQLGLPPCGWILAFSKPCPTCGMTTAFANAAHGRLGASLAAQPFGTLVAVGAAIGFWTCLHAACTGVSTGRVYAFLLRPAWVWTALALLAASWGYKLAVTG
ncbi:MAG: DUF2752 domain-containing protein [Phycisphaerales bacterium]|nr:DUF2752 domain-containing protein [Phycisphaerales bacterium]